MVDEWCTRAISPGFAPTGVETEPVEPPGHVADGSPAEPQASEQPERRGRVPLTRPPHSLDRYARPRRITHGFRHTRLVSRKCRLSTSSSVLKYLSVVMTR